MLIRVLPREHTGHSKHVLPTTQEKTLYMDITRWLMEIRLIIFFAAEDGEALLYTVNKRVLNTVLGCNLINDRIISVYF